MKKIALICLGLLCISLLAGCQLASPQAAPDALLIGTLLVPQDKRPAEIELKPIYGTKTTTAEGELSFAFADHPGEVMLIYPELDDAQEKIHSMTGLADKATIFLATGQEQTIELEAAYTVPHGKERHFWLYLIYQSPDGAVYIHPDALSQLSYSQDGQMSVTIDETTQMKRKDQTIQYQMSFKVSLQGGVYPDYLTIAMMDENDQVRERTTYPAASPPEKITPKINVSHLVLSQETADGEVIDRTVIMTGRKHITWPVLSESGFMTTISVPIE